MYGFAKIIYLLAALLCHDPTIYSAAHVLDLAKRQNTSSPDPIIYSDFKSCALTGCQSGTSASCPQRNLQLNTCVAITPFKSFGSCVENWPMDGRYCTTAVYADRSCRNLITEMDPTQDAPCVSCFNAVPDSPKSKNFPVAQSVKFYCTNIAVPAVTATIEPYRSEYCLNLPWLEQLPRTQLDTTGCKVLQDTNGLGAALLSFKAKMNWPVDLPTQCKVQVYSDPFCQTQVGVLDPVSDRDDRCITTFWQDVTGLVATDRSESIPNPGTGNTGGSALLRCYTT